MAKPESRGRWGPWGFRGTRAGRSRVVRVVLCVGAILAMGGLTGCRGARHAGAASGFELGDGFGIGGFLVGMFGDTQGLRSFDEISSASRTPDWMSR